MKRWGRFARIKIPQNEHYTNVYVMLRNINELFLR